MSDNIKNLKKLYESFGEVTFDDWLDGLNYSQALMVCVGAGPWKINRRLKVQTDALIYLGKKDIIDLFNCDVFPFKWQNDIIKKLSTNIYDGGYSSVNQLFITLDKLYIHYGDTRKFLYSFCGKRNGVKVLSLFCRDKLKIDSFPIDRHVKRVLQQYHLPTNEDDIINLCRATNLDPRKVATGIIQNAGVQNPNWSNLIKELNIL